jgi:hypothetical protein
MDNLHWPLSVLCKAVHFKNLTSASANVGISQPQLSRLIAQLESELNVHLLDRTAKRKSGWTAEAYKLAEIYSQNSRRLQSSIHEIIDSQIPRLLHFGTLEGLSSLAIRYANSLLLSEKVETVELNVYDQNELEEKFYNGDLDVIFTSREPSKQKLAKVLEMGYQFLESVTTNSQFSVMSPYEFGRLKKKPKNKLFISNSLSIRKMWLDSFGGTGAVPSLVQKTKSKDYLPVLAIASDMFNEDLWKIIKDQKKP